MPEVTQMKSAGTGAWNQIFCLCSFLRSIHLQRPSSETLRLLPPCSGLCSPLGISFPLVVTSIPLGPTSFSSLLSLASPPSSLPLPGPGNPSGDRGTGPRSLLTMTPKSLAGLLAVLIGPSPGRCYLLSDKRISK